jgi:pimeloyl-ACP methyl ester carboxylesterase
MPTIIRAGAKPVIKRARKARVGSKAEYSEALSLRPPSLWQLLLEGRAPVELWASLLSLPILRHVPKGDGQPVLIFPGLAAGDATTLPLRFYLQRLGYVCYGWNQGVNAGPRHGVLAGCKERVEELFAEHGRKVSLIGWSLGGLYAREMAKLMPNMTRQVITLGSPFAGHPHATNAWRIFEFLSGHRANDPNLLERLREAPKVPTTSIYSKSDGVVAWQCSVQAGGPQTENIAVMASHLGLGVNPLVLYALADRLSQKEGKWKPFSRRGLRGVFFAKSGFD